MIPVNLPARWSWLVRCALGTMVFGGLLTPPGISAELNDSQPASNAATTAAAAPEATSDTCGLRAGDEWWLVDSRSLPDCASAGTPALAVYKYASGGWQKSSVADLAAGHTKSTLTCLYVHGNRMEPTDAVERGPRVYSALVRGGKNEAPPVRFVMYSWPSERAQGLLRDVRIKADRTDADSYYCAYLLSQFPNQGELSLLGYSFGARILTGALHLRAGGSLEGRSLPVPPAEAPRVRLSLLAPAVHNHWILPGNNHGKCMTQVDRLFVGMNSCDQALQHYRLLDKCEKPAALGYTGVVGRKQLGTDGDDIVQLDACCSNGRTHDELPYYATPNIVAELQRNLLWQPVESR